MVNVLDYDILVRGFELQSCYYVYFRINIAAKIMNSLIDGLNNTTSVLLQG